jgi:L,D-peptidoglycan transpeptidase YkuD (ErfK/YbiS/YcfS/YnhG family)
MTRAALALVLLAGCAKAPTGFPRVQVPPDARQAIVVTATGPTKVQVAAWERRGDDWAVALPPRPGVIGRNGFADPGTKREGDGKTPSGVYRLRRAFGYSETEPTGLEYRPARPDDYWIDDPKSPDYNRWVSGPKPTVSHEVLRRADDFYKLAAVVEYNTEPVEAGKGSAIFLHVWGGPDSTTAGCVALAEADVAALLKWLDRAKNPVIVLGRADHP